MSQKHRHNCESLARRIVRGCSLEFSGEQFNKLIALLKRWPAQTISEWLSYINRLWDVHDEDLESMGQFRFHCRNVFVLVRV